MISFRRVVIIAVKKTEKQKVVPSNMQRLAPLRSQIVSLDSKHSRPPLTIFLLADLNSTDSLEREYLFIDVISTFLRAIRAGTINVQHGAVVLAHYGCLELPFDTCSKVIIDVLREENVMKDNPDIIVATLTRAIQEVCLHHRR